METYSENITKAHLKYMSLLDKNYNGMEHLYGKEYDNRVKNINRATLGFEKACKAEGLNYIDVSNDLITRILKIK